MGEVVRSEFDHRARLFTATEAEVFVFNQATRAPTSCTTETATDPPLSSRT